MFESLPPLDPAVQSAYLARLGVEALDVQPPSAQALRRVAERHAERVAYETLWIQAGGRWGIAPAESAARVAYTGRGGYCFHLNGALGLLLHSLGYAVRAHVGGVHGTPEHDPDAAGNHLVLTVTGLPDETNPAGTWYVDNGLGDALYDPLPLVAGAYPQPPFRLTLQRLGEDGWQLQHDPAGGFDHMIWTDAIAQRSDFETKHTLLSTSPDSGFVQVPMAERRDATGVDVIRGLARSRIGDGAFNAEPVTVRQAWFELLADDFGMRLDGTPPEARERLWAAAVAAQRRWEATRIT
ncbi:MAG TPA: arylamine N-acetyltransferase [Jatrophihabitans sp.]|jgi:arylamine N-acetyltransferase